MREMLGKRFIISDAKNDKIFRVSSMYQNKDDSRFSVTLISEKITDEIKRMYLADLVKNYKLIEPSYIMTFNKVQLDSGNKLMYDVVITVNKNSRVEGKENVLIFSLFNMMKHGTYIENYRTKINTITTSTINSYLTIAEISEFDEDFIPVIPGLKIVERKVFFKYNDDPLFPKGYDTCKFDVDIKKFAFNAKNEDDLRSIHNYALMGIDYEDICRLCGTSRLLSESLGNLFEIYMQKTIRVFNISILVGIAMNPDKKPKSYVIKDPLYNGKDGSIYKDITVYSNVFIRYIMDYLKDNKSATIDPIIEKIIVYIKKSNLYPSMPCIPFDKIDMSSITLIPVNEVEGSYAEVLEAASAKNQFVAELFFKDKNTVYMIYSLIEDKGIDSILNEDELKTFFKIKK